MGDAAVRRGARRSTGCSSPTTSRAASTRFLLSPADRSALLLGKALALLAYLRRASRSSPCPPSRCCCSAVARRRRCRACSRVLALGDLGVAAIGTLVGALAVRTRARDLLGPLLSLPLLVPVVIGAARATTPLLSQPRRGALPVRWLVILALYDLRVRGDRVRALRLPPGGLTPMYGKRLRALSLVTVAALDADARARLLLGAQRRLPRLPAEDLLHPRAAGDRHAVRLHRRRPDGDPAPAHARPALGHALLRRDPHLAGLRRRGADHRLDLGEGRLGALVGVGRADARLVPARSCCSTRPTSRCASRSRTPSARRARPRCSRSPPASSCRSTSRSCASRRAYVHPRTLDNISGNLPGRMQVVFYLALVSVGAAVDHAVALRDGLQARAARSCGALRRLLGGRRATRPSRRSAAPSDRRQVGSAALMPRAAAAHRRALRRRRLHRLRRADPALRRDHGRQAQPHRARARRADRAGAARRRGESAERAVTELRPRRDLPPRRAGRAARARRADRAPGRARS